MKQHPAGTNNPPEHPETLQYGRDNDMLHYMKEEQVQKLIEELHEEKQKVEELFSSLPNADDYYKKSEDDSVEELEKPEQQRIYAAYTLAKQAAVEKFLPTEGYNFQAPPKKVEVVCDNTANPYQITATYEDGTLFYQGEGDEGLRGLYEAQTEESRLRSESENYYLYDNNILNHVSLELFGLGVAPREGERAIRLLHGISSLYERTKHISAFISWAADFKSWVENPTDFYNAYQIVKHHPAMWLNDKTEPIINTDRETWLWHEIGKDEEGKTFHMFETGSAVKPDRQQHYHDLSLDVYSDTYEEGIIQLAWLINRNWRWDGTKRDTIEREDTELEALLKERIREAEENPGEGKSFLM